MRVNEVNLGGPIGAVPKVIKTEGKGYVAYLSIADNIYYKDKKTGENVEKTKWNSVTCFGDQALRASRLVAGDIVGCKGRLESNKYTKDGEDVYVTRVVSRRLVKLDVLRDSDVSF